MGDIYDVILETSIGKKYGKMDVSIRDKSIKGILRILKGEEPFEGIVDASGRCQISGNLSTLMRRIPYTATGIIKEHIDLELISEKERFQLVGKKSV